MNAEAYDILTRAEIKPTPNRLLVLKELLGAEHPLSLIEIEMRLATMERSSVLRALNTMLEADVVHILEDGNGVSKYEVCRSEHHDFDDLHPHFFCVRCGKTFCITNQTIPRIELPDNFCTISANYMLKGLCPSCIYKV